MGGHTMLVVGGIRPSFDNMQPIDSSGCDGNRFGQGLGMFSLNSHTWNTAYDPAAGKAPYQIHPNISKVIGGDETGGATLQAPVAGFAQKDLAPLLGARTESSAPASMGNATTGANGGRTLKGGAIAGIVIGLLVGLLLVAGLIWWLIRRRRGRWPPRISAPSPPVEARQNSPKFYSELDASSYPTELYGDNPKRYTEKVWIAVELSGSGPREKSLPPCPQQNKDAVSLEEMEVSPLSDKSSYTQ